MSKGTYSKVWCPLWGINTPKTTLPFRNLRVVASFYRLHALLGPPNEVIVLALSNEFVALNDPEPLKLLAFCATHVRLLRPHSAHPWQSWQR